MEFKRLIIKAIGYILIIVSIFLLGATAILFDQSKYGPAATGLIFTLFTMAVASRLVTSMDVLRLRIAALMKYSLPKCPICKSEDGYSISGWWPWRQYVKCKNCGAEWTSSDFTSHKGLRSLRLDKAPQNPEIYARFVSEPLLKIRRTYPLNSWKSLMLGNEVEVPLKKGKDLAKETVLQHRGYFLFIIALFLTYLGPKWLASHLLGGCVVTSLGLSTFLALFDFYVISHDKSKSFQIFVTALTAITFGLYFVFKE